MWNSRARLHTRDIKAIYEHNDNNCPRFHLHLDVTVPLHAVDQCVYFIISMTENDVRCMHTDSLLKVM